MSNEFIQRLDAMKASLAAAMPTRKVSRSLPRDPMSLKDADLTAGVVGLVCAGGGEFANYIGRSGELGEMEISLAGFVKVAEKTDTQAIEDAELALLAEMLAWCQSADFDLVPVSWAQSQQLEHPYGWVVLKTTVDS